MHNLSKIRNQLDLAEQQYNEANQLWYLEKACDLLKVEIALKGGRPYPVKMNRMALTNIKLMIGTLIDAVVEVDSVRQFDSVETARNTAETVLKFISEGMDEETLDWLEGIYPYGFLEDMKLKKRAESEER